MILKSFTLQNFRNYTKATFSFSPHTTIIIGQNAAGKSNLLESIFFVATGKSNRSEKEKQVIQFEKEVCRVSAETGEEKLEIVFADQGTAFLKKKYLVNGVARRRVDFAGHLTCVLFTPMDLDLVSGQPGNRRRFLDEVLEQVDSEYRNAHMVYTKALRQRNALLEKVQETGIRNQRVFAYWDDLLIRAGQLMSFKREEFIEFINARQKDFFPCLFTYDSSEISEERLLQYKDAEVGAGVTLVGPHRDDIKIEITQSQDRTAHDSLELLDARYFASRGQQRLIVLEMKLAQIAYFEQKTGKKPLLLLDDIFSELDSENIKKI
ncbi:MAG TPA: DNA replication and repair protein RecF, partial [Patescibacteria group bacterium]|nr:DNA replication and repair protein RecF [Patescibacteria group bacterium]